MILIHNIGGDIKGVCRYQVLINRDVICEFEHNRKDGLAVCLEKAAEAVRKDMAQKQRERIINKLINHANNLSW